jgi:anti-sigma regulatory factor (Ser/Thr protein kinase)
VSPTSTDPTEAFRVETRSDVVVVALLARERARAAGFCRRRSIEIAIVTSELASNLVKHAGGGRITVRVDEDEVSSVLQVGAHDDGAVIPDFAAALCDGNDGLGPIDPSTFLRRKGIGTGLGAVLRLSDSLDYRPSENGKVVVASFTECR